MSAPAEQMPAHTLGNVLDRMEELSRPAQAGEKALTVGAVMAAIGRRGYGPILLLVGLVSISPLTLAPGTTWVAASVAPLLSLQMAAGALHPWLPARTLAIAVPRAALNNLVPRLRPWADRLDAVLQPRLTFLAEPPFINFGALACAGAAVLTYPLGLIPVAPLAPGIAIALFGLGVTARDGMLLGLSGLSTCGAAWLVYLAFYGLAF